MCPKDLTDILMPRRDHENRLMGLLIIELDFEDDPLSLYIIIGEKI